MVHAREGGEAGGHEVGAAARRLLPQRVGGGRQHRRLLELRGRERGLAAQDRAACVAVLVEVVQIGRDALRRLVCADVDAPARDDRKGETKG